MRYIIATIRQSPETIEQRIARAEVALASLQWWHVRLRLEVDALRQRR